MRQVRTSGSTQRWFVSHIAAQLKDNKTGKFKDAVIKTANGDQNENLKKFLANCSPQDIELFEIVADRVLEQIPNNEKGVIAWCKSTADGANQGLSWLAYLVADYFMYICELAWKQSANALWYNGNNNNWIFPNEYGKKDDAYIMPSDKDIQEFASSFLTHISDMMKNKAEDKAEAKAEDIKDITQMMPNETKWAKFAAVANPEISK